MAVKLTHQYNAIEILNDLFKLLDEARLLNPSFYSDFRLSKFSSSKATDAIEIVDGRSPMTQLFQLVGTHQRASGRYRAGTNHRLQQQQTMTSANQFGTDAASILYSETGHCYSANQNRK